MFLRGRRGGMGLLRMSEWVGGWVMMMCVGRWEVGVFVDRRKERRIRTGQIMATVIGKEARRANAVSGP